jgi:hypothetical protein
MEAKSEPALDKEILETTSLDIELLRKACIHLVNVHDKLLYYKMHYDALLVDNALRVLGRTIDDLVYLVGAKDHINKYLRFEIKKVKG